jgi:hypothetical protein
MNRERPPRMPDSQSLGELRGEAYPNATFALRAAAVLAFTGFVNGTTQSDSRALARSH